MKVVGQGCSVGDHFVPYGMPKGAEGHGPFAPRELPCFALPRGKRLARAAQCVISL